MNKEEKYVGILFDVSGSMTETFESLTKKDFSRSDELINILEGLCKNQNIKVFTLLFGCYDCDVIQDFLSLLEISKKYFKDLYSSNSRAEKGGNGERIKNLLSNHNKRPLYIDKYLYENKYSPSERFCEFMSNLLERDYSLIDEIYNDLHESCKSYSGSWGVSIGSFFSKSIKDQENETVHENFVKSFEKAFNRAIDKIILEEKRTKKNTPDSLIKKGNDVINLIKYFDNKIVGYNQKNDFNLLNIFKKYIYGDTPLYTCITKAVDSFPKNILIDKFLIIISDGLLNDVRGFDYISDIKNKTKDIKVIGIYLTNKKIDNEKKFLDKIPDNFDKGAQDLMKMSSLMNYEDSIIKFFILKGWEVPISGDCYLFVEMSNSQNLNEFIGLLNEALDYDKDDRIINDISSAAIQSYVNSEIRNYKAKNQGNTGTCYANAIAACVCLASARVKGRPKLDFEIIRDKLKSEYGDKGTKVKKMINNFLPDYRLHAVEVNEEGARRAIINTRPCIVTFGLKGYQWGNFMKFFEEHPKGILTKKVIDENNVYEDEKDSGHAVVLTKISKDCLILLNSWGDTWGDKGYFRIENAEVLDKTRFYDVFWEISDLTQEEKEAYNKYKEENKKEIEELIKK